MDSNLFIDKKINHYANMILEDKGKGDQQAIGELSFYLALRRVKNGKFTAEDLGLMDAINDFLRHQGIVNNTTLFYK